MSLDKAPASGDLLGMSDEDIMNMAEPPVVEEDKTKVDDEDKSADQDQDKEPGAEAEVDAEAETGEDGEDQAGEDDGKTDVDAEGKDKTEAAADDKSEADGKDKAPEGADQEKKEASPSGSEGGTPEPTAEQAQAFMKRVMAPFKANGKMIELKTPEEVIQLMQMGANYTRKLQDIQPHRKVLLMLQNNDLLDEGKLSYLIDLDKKNPEAIKKLIKDAGIDPMDIDTTSEPAYSEGNHRVSDEEAGFRQALDELISTPAGKETAHLINTDWDQASKEVLWQSPEIMSVIHEQRENGIYAKITTELDRQKTLGQIPPNTPFLQAYKKVGDELAAAGAFGDPKEAEKKEPVATRAAAPKETVANGDQANAASPTRTTPRKAEKLVNPLAMSDEEILKLDNFNGRI